MVQQYQFGGSPMKDPNLHLPIFLEVCDTLKLNEVSTDAICLRLFPFLVKDKARAWLHSLPSDSIHTWDELTRAFLAKFFPPCKIASLRNQITTFTQREDELLYEAWERFKDLLQLCLHHGLEKWMIIQTFYNGVTQLVRSTTDTAAGGTLMNKMKDEVYNLIKRWRSIIFNGPLKEANPSGLEVSLKLTYLLYFLLKLML